MTPGAKWLAHAAVLAAGATGLVLLWTRYVAPPSPELDPPAIDATAQHLHVLLVPVLVFAFGVLWPTHILPHLRAGRQLRPTGLVLLALGPAMIVTGYGLQVAIDEAWRVVLGWAHAASTATWLLTFAVHLVGARRSSGAIPFFRWRSNERNAAVSVSSPPPHAANASAE